MAATPGTVLITGASSGIGSALARRYAADGWRVGLVARRADKLRELADEIRASGAAAAYAAGDVGDRVSLAAAVAGIRNELGPIDLLIANAGIGVATRIDPVNVADIAETFRINLLGVVHAVDAVLPEMLARGSGHIAAVSSLAGFLGLAGESAYCASKAAVTVFLDGLRMQLRPRGLAVTCVCPGFVKTPMTEKDPYPQPFSMGADRAASIIARGIRRRKKVLRFPWQTSLMVRVAGRLPDWLLVRVVPS